MTTPTQLFTLLDACFDAQNEATALWHSQEPEADDVAPDASASPETLLALVRAQHLRNFRLWHIEDTARRRDVTPDVIADCKYRIDRLNQERNDRIERVDACLVALLSPLLPASPAPHINTESLGMAIDRLSILSLKIWHMDEQVRRTDVTPEHIASCESRKPRKHANKETSAKSFTWAPKLIWKPSNTVFPVKIPRIVTTKILIKIEPVTFFL